MAIIIMQPDRITEDVTKLHNLISENGKTFLVNYAEIVENLSKHWKGSDAVANQTDLANVYAEITKLLKKLENLIVRVNNEEIIPLLRHIELSGGIGYSKSSLEPKLSSISDSVSITTEANNSITTIEILQDASEFNKLPSSFKMLKDELILAKEELFKNWSDGADIVNVKSSFKSFEDNVQSYIDQLELVRNNLNIVAENKNKLM